jgi:hypothetical protein
VQFQNNSTLKLLLYLFSLSVLIFIPRIESRTNHRPTHVDIHSYMHRLSILVFIFIVLLGFLFWMGASSISRAIGVPKIFVLAIRIMLSTTAATATVTASPVSSSQFTVQPLFRPTVQLPRMCGQHIVQFRVRPHSFDTGQWNFIQHRFGILFCPGIDQSHGDLQIGFYRRHVQRCPTGQHVRQFNVTSFVDQQSNQITFALGIGGGPMHGAPSMGIRGVWIGPVTP